MIAPTKEYDDAPALTPEQAAELVLRPLVTRERALGTRLAELWQLGHVVAPSALEAVAAWAQGVLTQEPPADTARAA
jgi:hypothetical protein